MRRRKRVSFFVEIANDILGYPSEKSKHKKIFISPDLFLLTSVDGWTEGDVVGELVSGFDPAETTGKIKSSASS